jgi:hypothetical protein
VRCARGRQADQWTAFDQHRWLAIVSNTGFVTLPPLRRRFSREQRTGVCRDRKLAPELAPDSKGRTGFSRDANSKFDRVKPLKNQR